MVLVATSAHSHPFYLRLSGTIVPYLEHTPISVLDDFGITRLKLTPGRGTNITGTAGIELEYVLPLETDLGLSVLLGARWIPQTTLGLAFHHVPVFAGAKVSFRLLRDYPWSVYVIARAGYNIFIPSEEYRQRVFVSRNLESVGGLYLSASLGTEVLLFGPISLISEVGWDESIVYTNPELRVLGEVKNIVEERLSILLGVSIDL